MRSRGAAGWIFLLIALAIPGLMFYNWWSHLNSERKAEMTKKIRTRLPDGGIFSSAGDSVLKLKNPIATPKQPDALTAVDKLRGRADAADESTPTGAYLLYNNALLAGDSETAKKFLPEMSLRSFGSENIPAEAFTMMVKTARKDLKIVSAATLITGTPMFPEGGATFTATAENVDDQGKKSIVHGRIGMIKEKGTWRIGPFSKWSPPGATEPPPADSSVSVKTEMSIDAASGVIQTTVTVSVSDPAAKAAGGAEDDISDMFADFRDPTISPYDYFLIEQIELERMLRSQHARREIRAIKKRRESPIENRINLQGIIGTDAGNQAIINDNVVGVGDMVGSRRHKARIIRITPSTVIFEYKKRRFSIKISP